MVSRHRKFGALVGYYEIDQIGLYGKLIAESQTVVEETEAYDHATVALRLAQRYAKFVVVVAYRGLFAPYGLPCLVERRRLCVD